MFDIGKLHLYNLGVSPQAILLPLPLLVPEQEHLTGYIPTVMGPVEFREWKSQLERMSEILSLGGVETTFQRLSLARTLSGSLDVLGRTIR